MNLSSISLSQQNGIDMSYDDLRHMPDTTVPQIVIEQLWTGGENPGNRVVNLRHAHDLGRTIGGAFALTSYGDGNYHFNKAINGLPQDLIDAMCFIAVDIELDNISGDSIEQALTAATLGGKLPRVIYTRRGFWANESYGTRDYNAWLWDARYQTAGIVPQFTPYGWWKSESQLIGVQIDGTHQLGGVDVDSDVFDLNRLKAEEMTDDQKRQLVIAALTPNLVQLNNILARMAIRVDGGLTTLIGLTKDSQALTNLRGQLEGMKSKDDYILLVQTIGAIQNQLDFLGA